MIAGLHGRISGRSSDSLVIDVSGVLYRVGTSGITLTESGQIGDEIEVHTHLVVREDQLALFGFLSEEELRVFETLIGVSGVGPRLACAILTVIRPETLHVAIEEGNADLLATVPGIGKKTAARLIVELRGKLPEAGLAFSAPAAQDADVVAALRALGYTLGEANLAAAQVGGRAGLSVEERVVAALQIMSEQ